MRSAILSFLTLLCLSNPAVGQLANPEPGDSEVIAKLYETNRNNLPFQEEQRDEYNPWTVHKKVALIGLGASMGATLLGAGAMGDENFATTVIPVVGPFITMARVENDPNQEYLPGGRPLLLAAGITQTAFLTYLTVAWIGETSYEGRNRSDLSVMPVRGQGGTGVTVRYQF